MVKTLLRMTLREIKQSIGRYFAIMAIIGLGVGFFAGVRMSQPNMIMTGASYVDALALHDYRMLSTLGFTEKDVAVISDYDGVANAQGAVYTEFLWQKSAGEEVVLIAHSMTPGINNPQLLHGRMPQNGRECLGDRKYFSEADLGSKIIVSKNNDEDTLDLLAFEEYTVVGIADTAYYLNFERGTASIGNGSIAAFILIPEEGFSFEVYHEIFVNLKHDESAYSNGYQKLIDDSSPELDSLLEDRAMLRYNTLLQEANEEIADAETELSDGWEEYYSEKEKAHNELGQAYFSLVSGEESYSAGIEQLAQSKETYQSGLDGLKFAEAEIERSRQEYNASAAALEAARQELNQNFAPMKAPIEQGEEAYQAALIQYNSACEEIEQSKASVMQQKNELSNRKISLDNEKNALNTQKIALQELEDTLAGLTADSPEYIALNEEYQAKRASYENRLSALNTAYSVYESDCNTVALTESALHEKESVLIATKSALEQNRIDLDSAWNAYYSARAPYDAELDKNYALLEAGRIELDKGIAEVENLKLTLENVEKELSNGENELKKVRKQLDSGWAEYYSGNAKANKEFKEAEQELLDGESELNEAKEDLKALKVPDTYLLTRQENAGYACFDNDTAIIKAISMVFPVFFFLVAALVCMTTMTRMVDEQRTQIGVLKAMGYSNLQVMTKYLLYSGSAAIIGSILGYALGSYCLPWIIWEIYGIMYGFADLQFTFDPILALTSFITAILCSVGATYAACRTELLQPAAELIRPKAPKAGKRIFLEFIAPIWNHMDFLHKVTARNVLRYKSRLVMMVLGIGGCTALLVTGFGIRDSIINIADDQFDKITLYEYAVTFNDAVDRKQADEYLSDVSMNDCKSLLVYSGKIDVLSMDQVKTCYMVISSEGNFDGFIDLHSGENPIQPPKFGEVIIGTALAQTLGVSDGMELKLRDSELGTISVTVSAICDNYIDNYIYLSAETYENGFGEAPDYKTLYVHRDDDTDVYKGGVLLSDHEDVSNISINQTMRDRIGDTLLRLNYIVVVVVVCAAALAFIVLYNLTNINITERIREIATIKVLGFYENETSAYVFREIRILAVLGSIVGLFMGKMLHAFVMAQVKVDTMFFPSRILPVSYLLSLLLTIIFTLVITAFLKTKVNKVDMAESLKSIE